VHRLASIVRELASEIANPDVAGQCYSPDSGVLPSARVGRIGMPKYRCAENEGRNDSSNQEHGGYHDKSYREAY